MYLARQETPLGIQYIIRHSFKDKGIYKAKDVVKLGVNPANFIVFTDDVHFEIDSYVLGEIRKAGIEADDYLLEELFLPFFDPYFQAKTEHFRDRSKYRSWKPLSRKGRQLIAEQTHLFDRRRIFFLRFGFNSPEMLDRSPQLYRNLLGKSRDEIEQMILFQELQLQINEYKEYLFFVFDLQSYFKDRLTRFMPHAFSQDEIDPFFLDEYCLLDGDKSFWAGYSHNETKGDNYLIRYLIMYFDFSHTQGNSQFTHNDFRFYEKSYRASSSTNNQMSSNTAAEIFGLNSDEVMNMSKKELTSLYRQKAHSLHPDKGGDNDQFVELTEAYNELLRSRS